MRAIFFLFFSAVETGGEKNPCSATLFIFLGFAIIHAYFEIRRRVCRKKRTKKFIKKAKKYRLSLKEWGHFRILRNKKIGSAKKTLGAIINFHWCFFLSPLSSVSFIHIPFSTVFLSTDVQKTLKYKYGIEKQVISTQLK